MFQDQLSNDAIDNINDMHEAMLVESYLIIKSTLKSTSKVKSGYLKCIYYDVIYNLHTNERWLSILDVHLNYFIIQNYIIAF